MASKADDAAAQLRFLEKADKKLQQVRFLPAPAPVGQDSHEDAKIGLIPSETTWGEQTRGRLHRPDEAGVGE